MQANEGTKRNARQEGEGLVVGTPAMSETIIGVTDSLTPVAEIALATRNIA
jgi:hypothetical protein